MNKIFLKGKNLLIGQQEGVMSAATVIMLMFVLSRVLGLIRQRILAGFFDPNELSIFFAAFRLPDLVFEVLVFGTFSSAFIPVFAKAVKRSEAEAWDIASRVVNIGLILFLLVACFFALFANQIYSVIAPGFTDEETHQIASLARILFAAQGFFVVSYVLTGVLESLRRFLTPALAPIFYNLGIILGTIILFPRFGLMAPAIGVVIGALSHFLIQLPLARKLGFHFTFKIKPNDGVRNIGTLAAPRVVDLAFDQIGKTVELSLASIISTASYTYYTFANTLQLLPVSLFGTSLAKAVLPTLSHQSDDTAQFKKTLLSTILQSIFFTIPVAVFLMVLRVPLIRLVYGTKVFDWIATIQTGWVLSAYAIGVIFQTLMAIITRAFFALHDSKTPVIVSMIGLLLLVSGDLLLVLGFHLPVWALAASFTFSTFVETLFLIYLMDKRLGNMITLNVILRLSKIIFSSVISGSLVYFLLKLFDRSVWVKQLSFLGNVQSDTLLTFQKFVLDTRYTFNLIVLTLSVCLIGGFVYLFLLVLLRSDEVWVFFSVVKRIIAKRVPGVIPPKEPETVTPPTSDTTAS